MHYLQMTAANRSMQFNYKNLLIVIYHLNDIYRSKQHLTHKKSNNFLIARFFDIKTYMVSKSLLIPNINLLENYFDIFQTYQC